MKVTDKDFENKLRKFFKDNADAVDAFNENDINRLKLPDAWKQEVEKNSSPEKKMLAHKMIADAMRKVAKQNKRRKVIIATTITVAACLTLFFGVTSPGQALARGAIATIVNIFHGDVRIETEGLDTTQSRIDNLEYKEFNNISEAAEYAGQPLIYVNGTDVDIARISVEAMDGINVILTEYNLPDSRTFTVFQGTRDLNADISFELDANNSYFEHSLFNGQTMYCTTYDDNTYSGTASWDNIELTIVSEKVEWEELINYVDRFIYY